MGLESTFKLLSLSAEIKNKPMDDTSKIPAAIIIINLIAFIFFKINLIIF